MADPEADTARDDAPRASGARSVVRRWLPYLALLVGLAAAFLLVGGWPRYLVAIALPAAAVFLVRRRWRDVAFVSGATVALLAIAALTALRVDLGPSLRAMAEAAGSNYLKRPMHIGRLSIHLWSGRFIVEDLKIEGLAPADRPFLTAKSVSVSMPWWTVIRSRHILLDSIDMSGWRMVIEDFDGRNNLPRFTGGGRGPSRFTTTLRSVHASDGEFSYIDHGSWSTVSPNLDVWVTNTVGEYRGRAVFSGGTVRIKDYLPMRSAMRASFGIKDGKVLLDRIEIDTDGAKTIGTGEVDFRRWPEQIYRVTCTVDLAREREIFFSDATWRARGTATFKGSFHLFKGGHELKGSFASERAHVNDFAFPSLRGSLVWVPSRFEVSEAGAGFYGGLAKFSYRLAPLRSTSPTRARFEASYENVDLGEFFDALGTRGVRFDGRASGHNVLEYPLSRSADHKGEGWVAAVPPPGATLLPRTGEREAASAEGERPREAAAPDTVRGVWRTPIGGEIVYRYGPEWVEVDPSWVATARTFVAFDGRTAYGDRSHLRFHARSADWQESDTFLAGVITSFGSPTGTVKVGGRGQFEGVMLNSFRDPRIEGRFSGEGVRAFDVVWGRVKGSAVIQNGYVEVTNGVVTEQDSEARLDGRFSLSSPRKDGGEEINARVRLARRDLKDLRHAFGLDPYPIDGKISGEYHIYGQYRSPFGFGRTEVEKGVAYGEPFVSASGSLRFEGNGVRLDGAEINKGGGLITGAAWIGWDGRYSFNADGRRIPVESVALVQYPQAPLSGMLGFSADGAATFANPRYRIRARIDGLFIKDEGIGQVTGRLSVSDQLLTIDQLEAASPRLAISGTGRIALTKTTDAELNLRFNQTSLDPYIRAFDPGFSPFTRAIAGGTLRLVGQLADPRQLLVSVTAEQVELGLFDYPLRNDGPIMIDLDRETVQLKQVRLVGENTRLNVSGTVDLVARKIALAARGDANLAVLQGFFRDIRSSGRAELVGEVQGTLDKPVLAGFASITDGRIRYFALPHAIEAINGQISFNSRGVWLDNVEARVGVGGGLVRFAGRIGLSGFRPGQLALTASGESIELRYPEGFRSVVDADLALTGTMAAPTLRGTVTVKGARWARRFDPTTALIGLVAGRAAPSPAAPAASGTLPLQFDIRIRAPSSLSIDSNALKLVASADLTLRGTYDRPLLFGRAEVERGEALLLGKRYIVTRGTIDFSNPARIDPDFDIAAETRVRSPGQTYIVEVGLTGTVDKLNKPLLSSDPPLPEVDILSLLFNETAAVQDAELRSLTERGAAERELALAAVASTGGQLITNPFSSEVERAFGLSTFQINPALGMDTSQRISATARLTIGKRISDRVYVTYSRSLSSSSRDDIIVIEFDQTDRLSWVLSQNEDKTYALDVRVRRTF
jgi:TamB, inner membrane protein subunit of TAM complex